jgi:hypothetical protein
LGEALFGLFSAGPDEPLEGFETTNGEEQAKKLRHLRVFKLRLRKSLYSLHVARVLIAYDRKTG